METATTTLAKQSPAAEVSFARQSAIQAFQRIRQDSEKLCQPLTTEDYVIQTVPEVSPPKWHLAHVTWFFETFILQPYAANYQVFDSQYNYLFNSYYQQIGAMHPRSQRGLLSRPTVETIYEYRHFVETAMLELLSNASAEQWAAIQPRLEIGLNHEQQHQELLLTDIKYNFAQNPLRPAYREDLPSSTMLTTPASLTWLEFPGGIVDIGFDEDGFAYDNESPRHTTYVQPYQLSARLITNLEFLAFIEDAGYQRPELWLSDGWATVQQQGWQAPLYWEKLDQQWWQMTLGGMRPLALDEPVCHISYYEADAYARWVDKRLPTEAEWEIAARMLPLTGHFREQDILHPTATNADAGSQTLAQMYGDVWEWTQSPYLPYPGYRTPKGAIGEYNGKFMCNQFVLRGGSCITPVDHMRVTYRNFFYPHERWQFKGFRLAEDI